MNSPFFKGGLRGILLDLTTERGNARPPRKRQLGDLTLDATAAPQILRQLCRLVLRGWLGACPHSRDILGQKGKIHRRVILSRAVYCQIDSSFLIPFYRCVVMITFLSHPLSSGFVLRTNFYNRKIFF